MTPFELLYYAAAAWTVAYIVTSTAGPWGVFAALREWRGGRWHGRYEGEKYAVINAGENQAYKEITVNSHKGLLDCIICLMPWTGLILRLSGANIVTDALAIAGVALMLHSYSGWRMKI